MAEEGQHIQCDGQAKEKVILCAYADDKKTESVLTDKAVIQRTLKVLHQSVPQLKGQPSWKVRTPRR